jgi:hypothetical protein
MAEVRDAVAAIDTRRAADDAERALDDRAVDELKFSVCLPWTVAVRTLALRSVDVDGAQACAGEPCDLVTHVDEDVARLTIRTIASSSMGTPLTLDNATIAVFSRPWPIYPRE